jgi:hypothetical protein
MPKIKTAKDLQLKEWQTARDVIVKYDGQLDSLRKNGFTFITGLLTAQSFLASNFVLGPANNEANINGQLLKMAVILATLVLLIALRLLDRNYQLFQKAAIKRAIVIEKCLNLELTETTFDVYHYERLYIWLNLIYVLFTVGAGLLGLFLIFGIVWAEVAILGATFVTVTVVLLIPDLIKLECTLLYTFDKLKVATGNSLSITMTNIGEASMIIPPSSFVWHMKPQIGEALPEQENPEEISLEEDDQYFFSWKIPATTTPGFYNFVVKGVCYYVLEDYFVFKKRKTRCSEERVIKRRIQVV